MKRYIRLWIAIINWSSKRFLENRFNTIANMMAVIFSLLVPVLFINIIYLHTDSLNGWNKGQVLLLLGTSRIVLALYSALFQGSINRLPEYIRHGDLDHLLARPISSQFYLSFRLSRPFELLNVLAGLALFIYALTHLNLELSLASYLVLLLSLTTGIIILYAIHYLIATFSIWMVSFYSLGNIFYMITQPLSLPTNIYGQTLSFILTYILPLGFIVMVPVQIFIYNSFTLFIVEIALSTILLLCSILFWNYALKHYTSASS